MRSTFPPYGLKIKQYKLAWVSCSTTTHKIPVILALCIFESMLEDKMYIEFAKPSDAVEISVISKNDIEHDLGWRYTPEKIASVMTNKSKNVVVARLDNKLTGFGIMTYHEDQANLDLLAVKFNYRRKKIGTHIVTWLEKVALTAGVFNIFVQVREINQEAIIFYKSLGFIVIEKEVGFYGGIETGIIMCKSLRDIFNP